MNKYSKFLFATLGIFVTCATSQAAELTSLSSNGLSSNRVDIIFVSEGYTADQEALFDSDVQVAGSNIFLYPPFSEYTAHFNQYSIFEPSNESGADVPSENIFVDTAFNATYECNGLARLLCADDELVELVVNSLTGAAQQDIIVLLVNDPGEGGSGGPISVISTGHPYFGPTVVHELAHTFGGLADEYEDPYPAQNPCNGNVFEPDALNVTSSNIYIPTLPQVKWNDPTPGERISPWVNQSKPSNDTTASTPGLYEGAYYCSDYFYRPTFDSLMRSRTQRLDPINEEILVRRIHDYVSPIDSFLPIGTTVAVSQNTQQWFSIQALSGQDGTSDIEWKLDGLSVGSASTLLVDGSILSPGDHTLTVIVTENTPHVRRDLLGQMTGIHSWEISVP